MRISTPARCVVGVCLPRSTCTAGPALSRDTAITDNACPALAPFLVYTLQLFVMGHTAQARMQQSDVLIVGLRGIGVEIGMSTTLERGYAVGAMAPEGRWLAAKRFHAQLPRGRC
jgi:hypothetical protein